MPARAAAIAIASLCAAAVAGCGTTTIRHVTTTLTRSASATASSSSTTSSPTSSTSTTSSSTSSAAAGHASSSSSPLAGRRPRAILARASADLRGAGGYAMRADLLQDGKRTIIDLSADGARRFEASLTTGPSMFSLAALPGSAYIRGNAAFWRGQLSSAPGATARARARTLAGHWLHAPSVHTVTGTLGSLAPDAIARCLVEDHGTLTVSGPTTVDGQRALIVHDAGNAPGATPSTIAVSSGGTAYPLRYVATGATRRGGRIDVCNDGRGDGATGTIAFSQFGRTPTVTAPNAAGGGAGGAPT